MKEFGKYLIFLHSLIIQRESFKTYYKLTLEESVTVGIKSILLIIIVSSFMGAVITIQTAYNLLNPMIPKFVIAQVVREMTVLEIAPTIMAIIYSGKVGTSMTGELGTMRITEQIDALEVMGINASSYLVLPKIIASLIMYPLLVILAGICALLGGYIAGSITEIISSTNYLHGLQFSFDQYTVFFSLMKSFVFAFIVSTVSCFKGYYITGGALEVGKASTSAVTTTVIAILVSDYFLAEILL